MAQLFQFIWKTRYLLIWTGILLASMSLHIQSAEVLRSYWFDNPLSPEHAFWQRSFWQSLSRGLSRQHVSWHAFWLAIGLVYSGCVFAAAAVHIASHKETETRRAPRWIITVALAAPVVIVLVAMIVALAAWWEIGRAFTTIANGCALLVVALLLLALLILWVERPGRMAAFSDRLYAVFSSPLSKLSLDIATGVFLLGFLVVPLVRIDHFIGLAIIVGSLPTLLISLAVLMYAIHRLLTLEGNKRWTRVALAISGVILVALLTNPIVHRSFLVFIAVACLAGVLWELRAAQPSYKAAISVLLGLFAVLLAIGDIAQTTKVRTFKPGASIEAPVLSTAFEAWINSRADIEDYKDDEEGYPVYIVAAQGGGLLAAYHAAMVLSHLQDVCPRFAQHVFAVSGVSGGSLGAAVFAGAVDRLAPKQTRSPCHPEAAASKRFQQYSEDFLKRDFLSPLVFMAVIPTIAQRALSLLPDRLWRWTRIDNIGVYDRARGLEYGFETASTDSNLRNGDKPDFFQLGMRSTWRPQEGPPALVISMTRADTGEPYWIAPFRMGERLDKTILDGVEVTEMDYRQKVLTIENPQVDVLVSTAVGLSARFPFVTPPGTLDVVSHRWLEQQDRFQTVGFVDGGYFENSGVESAWRLASVIKEERDKEEGKGVAKKPAKIYILRVGEISGFRYTKFREYLGFMKWFPYDHRGRLPKSDLTPPPGSELLAPLRALDASRQFRAWYGWLGTVANNRLFNNNTTATKIDTRDLFFGLTAETNPLPLGWQLTSETLSRIRARRPLPGQSCTPSVKDEASLIAEMNRLKEDGEDISALVDQWNYGCAAAEIWKRLSRRLTTAATR